MAAALLTSAVTLLSSYVVLFARSCCNRFGRRTAARKQQPPAAARYQVKAIGEGQIGCWMLMILLDCFYEKQLLVTHRPQRVQTGRPA
jgi:hypothetical protein